MAPAAAAAAAAAAAGGWPVEALKLAVGFPLNLTAEMTKEEFWRLSEEEKQAAAEAVKAALDHYFPMDLTGPLGVLIVTITSIMVPRIAMHRLAKAGLTPNTQTEKSAA